MAWLEELWRRLKMPRKLPLGPVDMVWRLARHVPVSDNRRRRRRRSGRTRPASPPATGLASSGRLPPAAAPGALPVVADPVAPPLAAETETAVIVGAGPGLGHALARQLAAAGLQVALVARDAERLDPLCAELQALTGATVRAYGGDATDERSFAATMAEVVHDLGVPHLVVYAVQYFELRDAVAVEVPALEMGWRMNCLGGFIAAREAARRMLPLRRGTIVLVGSTSGVIGREQHLMLSVGKFGLRAVSQVMARELGPLGVHVLHLVIDADIREPDNTVHERPQALPEDLAAQVLALHRQPRSCWSSELDLRPHDECFWQHC